MVALLYSPYGGRNRVVLTVSAPEKSDWLHDLVSLLFVIQSVQVRMSVSMRTDFNKTDDPSTHAHAISTKSGVTCHLSSNEH